MAFEEISNTLGADLQEQTTIFGPVIDEVQYLKIQAYVEEGKRFYNS